jgi:DNA-binding MarR family transcriptional regulator
MEKDEEWNKQTDITIATIRSAAKRDSAMRILAFLNNNSESRTIQEISDALEMDWGTAKHNLLKLTEAGFVELVPDKMDARCKYYQIADKKATEKAIELWEDRQRKLRKKEEENKFKPKVEPTKPTEAEEIE